MFLSHFISQTIPEYGCLHITPIVEVQPLKGTELARAKALMAALKKAHYTNKQAEHPVAGPWSEATVKLYTRGINIEDSTSKG